MQIVASEKNSIKIDTNLGFFVWIDIWPEKDDISLDWNKYIFFKDNPN